MAQTPSNMIPLGTVAPDFNLRDTVSNEFFSLKNSKSSKATLVMFISNHCYYVQHVLSGIVALANDYISQEVNIFAISSNDIHAYPDDSPEKMKEMAEKWQFSFPYLFDETQEVARAYSAACTPDFFLFDAHLKCVYRGQLDDSRPKSEISVTGKYLREALDAVLSDLPVEVVQKPSVGCNIKWK